jgi:Retinoic acid induced 16-like protein
VVDLLCVLCSRIRTYRQLLLIFFYDKNWSQPQEPSPIEEDFDEDEDEEDEESQESSKTETATITSAQASSMTNRKPEYEFLLFNYLLRYVHRESRIGDFARAGLLFLMDVAMGATSGDLRAFEESTTPASKETTEGDPITDGALALAEYILDGDFAEVLGAGLGAVYSLLPSKLELRHEVPEGGHAPGAMVLGGDLYDPRREQDAEMERARTFGLEVSTSPDFRSRLDHFLKIIEFIQDVLRRTTGSGAIEGELVPALLVGSAISQSILHAVKSIFLENVLYPSILESSNMDGSAIAVITYIDMTMRTLPQGSLAELFIDFLMNEDGDAPKPKAPPTPAPRPTKETKALRRKSSAMVLLEREAPSRGGSSYFSSLGRFTLKDLLFSNIESKSPTTATAVLQLLHTLLTLQPRFTTDRLLLPSGTPESSLRQPLPASIDSPNSGDEFVYPSGATTPKPSDFVTPIFRQPDTTYATHERELGLYLSLISRVDPTYDGEAFSTGYDNYLRDALDTLQRQQGATLSLPERPEYILSALYPPTYRLNPNDTLLTLVLQSLRRFFAHTPEYNIALTGLLFAIASSPCRSLAGWMTFIPTAADEDGALKGPRLQLEAEDDGDDRSIDWEVDEQLASGAHLLPASSINDPNARPVLHSILQGLVIQLDRYRVTVDDFDRLLSERRQGLMFEENLTDALGLDAEAEKSSIFATFSPPQLSSPPLPSSPPPKPKNKSAASFMSSFLTPKKDKSSKVSSPAATPATRKASDIKPNLVASPFATHYELTSKIQVRPFEAPLPVTGPWQPQRYTDGGVIEEDDEEEWKDDAFGTVSDKKKEAESVRVTLSQLLDNVVILEESIKELSAIIQARRSLGIDAVRYL